MIFGVGMLVAAVGGIVFALALRGATLPPPLRGFVGLLGIGILAANLLGLGPPLTSVPVFVLYGAGWVALALQALPGRRPTSHAGG